MGKNETPETSKSECHCKCDCNSKKDSDSTTDGKWFKTDSNWIKETQGTLMLVATVIATVTFQSIVNPPKELNRDFLTFNTIAFISALSIILLLICGLPLKNKVCAWLLTIAMSSTIIFIGLTYISVLETVPDDLYGWYDAVEHAYNGSIIALMCVFGFVFLAHTAHFIYWLIKLARDHRSKQAQPEGEEMV
ncbi:PGG domain [Dillenia turbinata]|uniref:PGG domain n=1 Tax=Dillenia turbinata TaxID=194707 RepID=A0AAN8UFS3_9MAGN